MCRNGSKRAKFYFKMVVVGVVEKIKILAKRKTVWHYSAKFSPGEKLMLGNPFASSNISTVCLLFF